jgi:hypothetical protein
MTVPRRQPWTQAEFDAYARQRGFGSWAEMQRGFDLAAEGSNTDIEAAIERVERNYERIETGLQRLRPGIFEPKGEM